jgi:hypothetical protein
VGPLHLFRFSLDQTSLRRWEGNGILRSTALRSFRATAVNRQNHVVWERKPGLPSW